MAKVHIHSGQGAVGTGDLQLENGAPMDATLRPVTDAANTASPLELSTGLVAVTSTLKIATTDTEYIDAEDGSGNNRFTVSRQAGSQVVDVDFASNPTSATDQVGAIRTYQDGVSLSDTMAFLRNGNVGVGTSSPTTPLQVNVSGSSDVVRFTRDTGTNGELSLDFGGANANFVSQQGGYTFSTSSVASAAVVTPTGNVGIGTSTPSSILHTVGVGGAGSSPIIETSTTTNYVGLKIKQNGDFWIAKDNSLGSSFNTSAYANVLYGSGAHAMVFSTNATEKMRITSAGNVGIGTTSPNRELTVNGEIQATNLILTNALYVGGTAAANALDDYEEGTFTPVVAGSSSAGSATYIVQKGLYTKIGRQVTFEIMLYFTGHTGTGNIWITGLPFATKNETNVVPSGSIYYTDLTVTQPNVQYIISSNSQTLQLTYCSNSTGFAPVAMDSSFEARIVGTYFV